MKHTQESAELVALRALEWLAGNDDLLPVFLNASGAGTEDLRQQAGDPGFLAAVLEFILMDDAWIVAFCDSAALPYDAPMRARALLPGGEQVNWT